MSSGLDTYRRPDIVSTYDAHRELHSAETELFEQYVRPGSEVLDLGVGAGRTTPYLAQRSSRYVGVDLSEAMVARCRERFSDLTFLHLDATDLSTLPSSSFDVVVFSFNGIDTIPTLEGRHRCLKECARLLREDGTLIYSVHNARCLIFAPVFDGAGPLRAAWRIAYASIHTAANFASHVPSPTFWRGAGYVFEPLTDGGMRVFAATPQHVVREVAAIGLQIVRRIPGDSPRRENSFRTPWYYYACVKRSP